MYRLLSRIDDGIKPMLDVLQSYVTATGFESVRSIPAKDQKVLFFQTNYLFILRNPKFTLKHYLKSMINLVM